MRVLHDPRRQGVPADKRKGGDPNRPVPVRLRSPFPKREAADGRPVENHLNRKGVAVALLIPLIIKAAIERRGELPRPQVDLEMADPPEYHPWKRDA